MEMRIEYKSSKSCDLAKGCGNNAKMLHSGEFLQKTSSRNAFVQSTLVHLQKKTSQIFTQRAAFSLLISPQASAKVDSDAPVPRVLQ